MVKKLKIEALSSAELEDLRTKVEYQLRVRRDQDKAAVRAEAKRIAEEAGFSLEEVIGRRSVGRPEIINPKNPKQSWTGRGRPPNWAREQGLA